MTSTWSVDRSPRTDVQTPVQAPSKAFATASELARELGYTRNRLVRLLDALQGQDRTAIRTTQVGTRRLYARRDVLRLLS